MKKIAYIYIFLFFAMILSCVANAQCPPGTWGLDIIINPDQYPEETSFVVLNTEGDTLMQGGPFLDIIDYQPQYISTCSPALKVSTLISDPTEMLLSNSFTLNST